ncbi:MAG TPA: protein kinase [Vicinamibacterales bacterium]|nr:protein kinase [Vicinamibacterales bacterium]
MTFLPGDWTRVQEIFHESLGRRPDERAEFLRHTVSDPEVRRQVAALLAAHETAFLADPMAAAGQCSEDLTGRVAGSYRLVSRIGSGGIGDVYLAHDQTLDRPVAIKLLSRHTDADPGHLRRFHQEAKAVSALNHPHILVIHAFGDIDGRPFIATEFIEGQTLRERLNAGPVGVIEAVDIATQIASALAAAHERGIVHRDIKPENVMIRPDGYVKVLDFGLAKPLTRPSAADTGTQPGIVIGTPRYMSPEQARGLPVDARSDVWSLAAVLYEMIAGVPPFQGNTLADVFAAILTAAPAPLTGAPIAVAQCIARALSKDPAARLADGREMHAALQSLTAFPPSFTPSQADEPPKRPRSKGSRRSIDSIAVLPLAAASQDVDYLADGITESVITALSRLPKLKVMARNTVFRYKGRHLDAQAIGRELGVRAVLTGRLAPAPEGFVVSVELVDAIDGSQIWGGQLQRSTTDAFALQEETAAEIAEQLRPRLTPAERRRVLKRATANPRAYEAYLKGRFHLAKRSLDGFTKAIAFFEQAIVEDRDHALAYAGLADCWTLLSAAAYGEPSVRLMDRARESAGHAVRLDPMDAEVQTASGFVKFRIDWDWSGAETALRRACDLSPGHAPAHHRLALLLSALARHDEALVEIRRACELDPLSLIISTAAGRVLHFQRQYERAIEQCLRTLDMDAAFAQARLDLGMAYAALGRYDEAIAEFESTVGPDDPRSVMRSVLGNMYGRSGRRADAEAVLLDLERRYRRGDASSYDLALPLIGLGRTAEALDWLERAAAVRSGLLVYLKVEPMFDPIRSEPRFGGLLERLRLPSD